MHQTLGLISENVDDEYLTGVLSAFIYESFSAAAGFSDGIMDLQRDDEKYTITNEFEIMKDILVQTESDLLELFPGQAEVLHKFYDIYYGLLKEKMKGLSFFRRKAEMKRVKNLLG